MKKAGKLHYEYKKHITVDKDGLAEAVHTTPANEYDSSSLEKVIKKDQIQKKRQVDADKGYKVPYNDVYLKEQNIKNGIQHKAYRNRPLTSWETLFNKLICKQCWVVERTFGGMSRWFGAGKARYKWLAKVHSQHVHEAIAYNLKRSPRPVWVKCAHK